MVPGAAAVGVTGTFESLEGARFTGALRATDLDVVDLAPAVAAGQPIALAWESASGYQVTRRDPAQGDTSLAAVSVTREPPARADIVASAAGAVTLRCGPACRILVLAEDDSVLAREAGGAHLALVASPITFASGELDGGEDSFSHVVPAGSSIFDASWQGALDAVGPLQLFLADALLEAETTEGRIVVDALERHEPRQGPGGLTMGTDVRSGFALLRLEGARLSATGSAAVAYAQAPTIAVRGAFAADGATGELVVAGRSVELRDDALLAEGELWLGVSPGPDGLTTAPTPAGTLTGNARRIVVDGEPLVAAGATREQGSAAALGAGAILLLVAGKLAYAALYTRLDPARVLENPNRGRVFAAIERQPGVSVAEIVRATSLAEVVVRHHLRMLETHQFVAARAVGRTRGYFAAGAIRRESAGAGILALKDETRRAIACVVHASLAPLTQKEIAALVGASPRLVSYHLARLEKDGLVQATGIVPRRYTARPSLGELLRPNAMAAAASV